MRKATAMPITDEFEMGEPEETLPKWKAKRAAWAAEIAVLIVCVGLAMAVGVRHAHRENQARCGMSGGR